MTKKRKTVNPFEIPSPGRRHPETEPVDPEEPISNEEDPHCVMQDVQLMELKKELKKLIAV